MEGVREQPNSGMTPKAREELRSLLTEISALPADQQRLILEARRELLGWIATKGRFAGYALAWVGIEIGGVLDDDV